MAVTRTSLVDMEEGTLIEFTLEERQSRHCMSQVADVEKVAENNSQNLDEVWTVLHGLLE